MDSVPTIPPSPPAPVPQFIPIWSIPPCSPPIHWNHDLRLVLALELDQMRYREKNEPYYRGESNRRPTYLDHDPDHEGDTDSDTDTDVSLGSADSDETMPALDVDVDRYVVGDAPVHATPIGRWSSAFLQDFGSFGVRTPTNSPTTSPPRQRHLPAELPTHSYTRAELEKFEFEVIRDWKGPTPVADRKGRVHVADNADFDALPDNNTPASIHWGIEYSGGGPFTSVSVSEDSRCDKDRGATAVSWWWSRVASFGQRGFVIGWNPLYNVGRRWNVEWDAGTVRSLLLRVYTATCPPMASSTRGLSRESFQGDGFEDDCDVNGVVQYSWRGNSPGYDFSRVDDLIFLESVPTATEG
ncbi:hypothetical protein B0H11DRAFT_1906992 [Mycena galericulata]|nr:hypothetical protein B0H11DRAFT_1906992 [Mycena galericulata]